MMNTRGPRRASRFPAGPPGSDAPETPRVERRARKRLGPDACPVCLRGDVLEVEVRCVACGVAGCWHCYVTVTRAGEAAFLCSACAEAEGVLEIPAPRDARAGRGAFLDAGAHALRPPERPRERRHGDVGPPEA